MEISNVVFYIDRRKSLFKPCLLYLLVNLKQLDKKSQVSYEEHTLLNLRNQIVLKIIANGNIKSTIQSIVESVCLNHF